MDLAKQLSLFDRSALFFPRLDKLEDAFEGYFTKAIITLEKMKFEELPQELKTQIPDEESLRNLLLHQRQIRAFTKEQREITFVNSWYCNEHESAAMWSLYLKSEEGIAVQSSYERLVKSLVQYKDFLVFIGLVNYIDYDREVIPSHNMLAPLMYKRKSFEHERELRAVIWTLEHGKNTAGEGNRFKDQTGLYVPIDVPTLVQKIYVAPTAPTWISELIESLVRRFGHTIPVVQSSLAEAAFY